VWSLETPHALYTGAYLQPRFGTAIVMVPDTQHGTGVPGGGSVGAAFVRAQLNACFNFLFLLGAVDYYIEALPFSRTSLSVIPFSCSVAE